MNRYFSIVLLFLSLFFINIKSYAHGLEYYSLYYGKSFLIPSIRILNNPKNITLKNIDRNGDNIWEITYDNLGRPVLQKVYGIESSFYSDIDKEIDLSKNIKTYYKGYYKFEYPDDYTITEEFFPIWEGLKSYSKYKAQYKLDNNKQIIEKYFPFQNKTEKIDNNDKNENWQYTYDKNGLLTKKEKYAFAGYYDEYLYYYDENKNLTKMYYKDVVSSNGEFDEYVFLYDKNGNIISLYSKPHKSKNIKTETMAYNNYGHRIKYSRKYKINKLLYATTKPFFSLLEYVIDELAH